MTLPPLLMLAEGRKPRPRKAAKPLPPKEIALHMQVSSLLKQCARPDWRWTHIPTGEKRDIRTAGKLKAMGVKPGWADFVLVSPIGLAHFLELKRLGGALSEPQEQFQTWAIAHGVPFAVADSFDQALAVLRRWDAIIGVRL